jgi:phospholipid transport system substrate-binding protein
MLTQLPTHRAFPLTLPRQKGGRAFWCIALLLSAVMVEPPAANASQPGDTVKRIIEDGRRILQDPCCQSVERKLLQQERLRDLLYRDFDFVEFSRRVLADKWGSFSPNQREEFVQVFSRFLADFYLSRLQRSYANESVTVRDQTIVAPGRALVRANVVWRHQEVPIDIRLHTRGGSWKIYDLGALGISAVQLYRAQFQDILRTRSPADVIELIKGRLQEP